MFHFLETDIREQKKYEMRTQTSVDNTVNDLRYEIKFENCVKDKNNFFIKWKTAFFSWKKKILFSDTHFLKIPKNLVTSAFFFAEADTKKHRYASAKASNAALVKLTDWIIKNDNVINFATFFCKLFQHYQTSNVIWLSATWLLILWLEVVKIKAFIHHKAC